jgi:hypothetical protein
MLLTEPRPGFSFYVVGSDDEDSLVVRAEHLGTGDLMTALPVASLPWRDLRLIERHGRRRQPYGCCEVDDPLAEARLTLDGEEVEERTDVIGARLLTLNGGIAILVAEVQQPVQVPCLRVALGAAMPVVVRVAAEIEGAAAMVHVTQLSGGRRIGGVALELRGDQKQPDERSRSLTASGWRAQVDPRLAAAYDRAAARGSLDITVGVFLRVATAPDPMLPGLVVGTQAGEVVTATLVLVHLPTVAVASSVSYVELAGTVMWDVPY